MNNAYIRPVRDLRNNYAEIEKILDEHNQVIITKNGNGVAVLMNIEDYSEIEDFIQAKKVAKKLGEAEKEASSPNAKWIDYEDFFNEMKEKYREV